jgi:hypothetical protein
VEQATPGFPAGAAAARFQPDLVVLATTAPDAGGDLVGLRADRDLRSIPIVAVGLADWTDQLRDGGCLAVLPRPLGEGALVRAASDALGIAARGPRLRAAGRGHTRREG